MPDYNSSMGGSSSSAKWLEALVLPQDSLIQLLKACPQLAAAAGVGASSQAEAAAAAAVSWRFLPSVTPAWEVVRAPGAPDHQHPQQRQQQQQQHPTGLAAPTSAPATAQPEVGSSPRQQQQQVAEGLQSVPLPPLRFFLRSERDISAAYIPSLDDWLQAAGSEEG
jgi:hypothetical protein